MAFIDAAHPHPWPLIDTLFVFEVMVGAKTVIHHDLDLFRKQKEVKGIGPKYLYDQFPDTHRGRGRHSASNIFNVSLDIELMQFESIFCDCINLPWTCRIGADVVQALSRKVATLFGKDASAVMADALERYNVP